MLHLASAMNLLLAAFHIGIVFVGAPGYRYFRAPEEFAIRAAAGDPAPALITLAIAGVFLAWSAYAASAAGLIRRLPMTRPAVGVIAAIFLLRGLFVIPQLLQAAGLIDGIAEAEPRDIVFSASAFVIGAIHAIGLWTLFQEEKPCRQ
ncbi:hypothetical protein [Novosphingobium mangrovi (ex Huang et al. 2023)]|uniref:DUF2214 domain-containing protein n=1 Tax=Novosphingobium mangrovi (ex Huang et al. 2023) TaxID=2976432 RepID=A0ABT2I9Q2_9SPHN|nr:hypothetical protein [Novosphingobium mangrovi (ex Huang et al. 2023)]MCT2401565.1 hypothetical protein [Novosphingobium mangrovi (ex Huang et al. 2023)]